MALDLKTLDGQATRIVPADELSADLGAILAQVQDDEAIVDVTVAGRVVARIVPRPSQQSTDGPRRVSPAEWAELNATQDPLVARLAEIAPRRFDAEKAIREHRREV